MMKGIPETSHAHYVVNVFTCECTQLPKGHVHVCVSELSILSLSMILIFDFRIFRRCGIFVFIHDIFFGG